MPKNCAKLVQSKVKSANLKIDVKQDTLSLGARIHTNLLPPIDKQDNTAMVEAAIEVKATDENEFFLKMETELIFEFTQIPQSYQDVVQNLCYPQIEDCLFELVDRVLEATENLPINLKTSRGQVEA